MIVLPIVANEVILSLEITFKQIKRKKEVLQADKVNLPANDFVVGKTSIQQVENISFFDKNPEAIASFARRVSNPDIKSIYVTTGNYEQSEFYDIYKLPSPPSISIPLIDFLYGYLVNDLRLKKPEQDVGKYLSFKQLDIDEIFSDDVLKQFIEIKSKCTDKQQYINELIHQGYEPQLKILDFFDTLDFKVLDQTIMTTKSLDNTITSFEVLHGKVDKQLTRYKQIAIDNNQSYTRLATANHTIYERPLDWPILSEEQQKILLKKAS